MNGYVLIRTDQGGGYVCNPVSPTGGSYSHNLRDAKIFPSEAAADAERCVGNERIASVESQLQGPR